MMFVYSGYLEEGFFFFWGKGFLLGLDLLRKVFSFFLGWDIWVVVFDLLETNLGFFWRGV